MNQRIRLGRFKTQISRMKASRADLIARREASLSGKATTIDGVAVSPRAQLGARRRTSTQKVGATVISRSTTAA